MPFQEQSFDDISRLLMQNRAPVDPAMLRRSLANTEAYAGARGASDAAQRGLNQTIFDRQLALRQKAAKAERKDRKKSQKYSALGAGLGVLGNMATGFLSPDDALGGGIDPMTGYPRIGMG